MHICIKTLFALLFTTFSCLSQKKIEQTYAGCEGTIKIAKSNAYDLQFIGKKGKSTSFARYPKIHHIASTNQIWFSFKATVDGVIELKCETDSVPLSLLVFESLEKDVCREILSGKAFLHRVIEVGKGTRIIDIHSERTEEQFTPLSIQEGKEFYFVLITEEGRKDNVRLEFKFLNSDPSYLEYEQREINFFEADNFSTSLKIRVRDKLTGYPLVSNIVVKGIKQCEGFYNASDLNFHLSRNGKLDVYCEREGYFFKDTIEINVNMKQERVILIELEPVRPGKSLVLDGIDFIPGTSQITDKSLPKLKRLSDFLALNSTLRIEIQGHVFDPSEVNSFAGQKMSEARAKCVMKYLIDHGIRKDRMTAVGFGNSRPIYQHPKYIYEEQANRRVEILIK